MSQPSLSKSIAGLEAELAVKLFDRDGGAARPTEFGLYVVERAEGVLKAVTALKRDVARLAGGETGRLRIGVGGVTRIKPLPDVINHLTVKFPHLQIESRQERIDTMIQSLRGGKYDLIFCSAVYAEAHGDLIRVKIFEDLDVAAVSPSHPLAREQYVAPARLLEYPVTSFPMPANMLRWFGDITPEARKNLEAFITDDHELIKSRPIGSDYVAMAPRLIFEREFANGTLVELPIDDPPKYECWMLTTQARWQSPVVKIIAEIAKAASAKARPQRTKKQAREKEPGSRPDLATVHS